MIDFLQTPIGDILKKTKILSDAAAWFDSMDYKQKEEILRMIQVEQLEKKGINEDGEVIGYYSQLTEILSGGRKKFNEHYTLDDTGAFFRSMYIVVLLDTIVIEADGEKDGENLFDKYGEGIIGLAAESIEKVQDDLREKYLTYFKETLGIN